jgi:hypothetical protein
VAPKVPEFLPDCSPFVSVYIGRHLIGHIISRDRAGFEAFDAEQNSLGTFSSEKDAANAISDSAKQAPSPRDNNEEGPE